MSNKKTFVEEKRRNPRFPIDATITMVDKTTNTLYSGVCCDVSAKGLLVICEDDLSLQTSLHLEIKEIDGVFIGDGIVVRKSQSDQGFLIGFDVDFKLLAEDMAK